MDQPATGEPQKQPSPLPPTFQYYRRKDNLVGAIVLIVLGLLLLANNLLPEFDFSDYWPLILVAIGISLLFRAKQ